MEYQVEAQELVRDLNQRMGASPYDVAWLARLRHPNSDTALWPDLLDWLMQNQNSDGSWGGQIPYYHDRIICTLAAVLALRENGHRSYDALAIKRAENYLWLNLHRLSRDHFELVGFELVFPTLLGMAQAAGLDTPTHTCGYGRIQTAKLRLIPPEMLYSPKVSTVHSLEFLGPAGDPHRLAAALNSVGALGNSPSATSYYAQLCPSDDRALNYLRQMRDHLGHVVYLYPCRIFELSWVLNNLAFSGVPVTSFANGSVWDELRSNLTESGIGLDPTFGIPDGDITSVTCRLLIQAGYDISPAILSRFEVPDTHVFRTYSYERNLSIGTNVHALETLGHMPDYANRRQTQESIMVALLAERQYDLYWVDKWHVSPYYGTAHVVVAFLRNELAVETACSDTVEWLLHTQRSDGSWGFFKEGTAEETAYVLTALLYYHQYKPVKLEALKKAAAYLQSRHRGPYSQYPELWIGKCLYTPVDVVRSAVLAALILYNEIFGRLPD